MMNQPDPRKHQLISFAKSAIRIIGSGAGFGAALAGAAVPAILMFSAAMFVAELVGIWEELV